MHGSNLVLRPAFFFAAIAAGLPLIAQPAPVLTWITNSSVKIQQLIGEQGANSYAQDTDRQTGSNLINQTYGLYQVGGTDLGNSFEYGGRVNFLFGDTLYLNAGDTMAWSTSTNPLTGLHLNFFTNRAGSPAALTIQPPKVDMGPFNVPAAGLSNNGNFYIVCKTGYAESTLNTNDYSVLVRFDPSSNTFYTGRTMSALTNGGHFIDLSLCHFDTNIIMFGLGNYRASAVYLATIPAANFESGNGELYFTGLTNGSPTWSSAETNALPLVSDNPANPTIGNVSVNYSRAVGLWLMTYDGGRKKEAATGVYFCCAPSPWGPWSQPQLIFNKQRDHGLGVFMHNSPTNLPAGPAGPTIGNNDPNTTAGADYAPYMIERFTTVQGSTLTIYYTLSTWNPYTIVLMKSDFTIIPRIDPGTLEKTSANFSFAWNAPANLSYQVDYSGNLLSGWTTLTNLITSTNGTFNFTDNGTNSGGFGNAKFYRLRTAN